MLKKISHAKCENKGRPKKYDMVGQGGTGVKSKYKAPKSVEQGTKNDAILQASLGMGTRLLQKMQTITPSINKKDVSLNLQGH